jgi:hypothetical protein
MSRRVTQLIRKVPAAHWWGGKPHLWEVEEGRFEIAAKCPYRKHFDLAWVFTADEVDALYPAGGWGSPSECDAVLQRLVYGRVAF